MSPGQILGNMGVSNLRLSGQAVASLSRAIDASPTLKETLAHLLDEGWKIETDDGLNRGFASTDLQQKTITIGQAFAEGNPKAVISALTMHACYAASGKELDFSSQEAFTASYADRFIEAGIKSFGICGEVTENDAEIAFDFQDVYDGFDGLELIIETYGMMTALGTEQDRATLDANLPTFMRDELLETSQPDDSKFERRAKKMFHAFNMDGNRPALATPHPAMQARTNTPAMNFQIEAEPI